MGLKKIHWVIIGVAVAGPIVCCGGGIAVFWSMFARPAGNLNAELAAARREGLPTTPRDLAMLDPFPESQNAYPVYEKLVQLAGDGTAVGDDLQKASSGSSSKATPEQTSDATDALPRLKPAFDLARKAATYPHCRFPIDWDHVMSARMPEEIVLRHAAMALCFEAQQRIDGRDWKGALADVAAAQRIGQHLDESHGMLGLLMHQTIEITCERRLANLLDAKSHDANVLAAVRKTQDGFGPLPSFRQTMDFEIVMGLRAVATFRHLEDFTGAPSRSGSEEDPTVNSPFMRAALAEKLVKAYRKLMAGIPKDPNQWDAADRAYDETSQMVHADNSPTNFVASELFLTDSHAAGRIGTVQAHRRLTETAVRLLQDRLRNGKLPASLPDYGTSSIDPFTGKPLHYRKEGNGFTLYSEGADRIDHGGVQGAIKLTGGDEVITISGLASR